MATMLDIAGGTVIGAFAVGMFYMGLVLAVSRDDQLSEDMIPVIGGLMMLVSGTFCIWLVFWRTGMIAGVIDLF